MPNATNISTPGAHKMSRELEDVVKLQRKEIDELKAFNAELIANETVAKLKAKHIVIPNDKVKEKFKMLYQRGGQKELDAAVAEAEECWKREEPKSTPADATDVLRYQRTPGESSGVELNSETAIQVGELARKYQRSRKLTTDEAIAEAYKELGIKTK